MFKSANFGYNICRRDCRASLAMTDKDATEPVIARSEATWQSSVLSKIRRRHEMNFEKFTKNAQSAMVDCQNIDIEM
jgi:hypothetical protein